jgi:hypothetical protein
VLNAVVVYGTAWVIRTLAFATVNYKDPQEEANVVDYAVTIELVIIAEPEPFTF